MNSHHHTKLVHEGRYAAEVEVDLIRIPDGRPTSRSLTRRNWMRCVRPYEAEI